MNVNVETTNLEAVPAAPESSPEPDEHPLLAAARELLAVPSYLASLIDDANSELSEWDSELSAMVTELEELRDERPDDVDPWDDDEGAEIEALLTDLADCQERVSSAMGSLSVDDLR